MLPGRVLQTTSGRGIDRTLPVWRRWQRAKKLGTCDPADVDLGRDIEGFVGFAMGQFSSRTARIERVQTTRTGELDVDGGT